MRVISNLFEPELDDWKKYKPTDSEFYILTDENDLVEKNLVLHLTDKNSDLYKFAMYMLPCCNGRFVDYRKSEFTVFENIDEFCNYINNVTESILNGDMYKTSSGDIVKIEKNPAEAEKLFKDIFGIDEI